MRSCSVTLSHDVSEVRMTLTREHAAALGQETQRILADGHYISEHGTRVDLVPLIAKARAATRSYPPDAALPAQLLGPLATTFEVTNETTLAATRRLVTAGYRVAALNFASAHHPGGGWLSGARAQEESLARASALVPCIADDPMYDRNERVRDALYTSSAIYAPDVPVFRDDDGQLLDEPYLVALITAPAVNAGVVLERDRSRRAEITATMRERVARELAIAASHGHDALVLGAWGCGVFKNDPAEIAALFAAALHRPFQGAFLTVVFAVLDTSPERRFIGPFARVFRA
jgi:uncharacterized protein (TIGR02452 family)